MKQRKFSLIIPTRERVDTLQACLKTAVHQTYANLEIIVSDNYSQDATKACIESFNDARIRYINTGKRVSMSENWEFALAHVTGDWVTILGDDDGLLPGCFESINDLINVTNTQAIRTRACSFVWPAAQPTGANIPLNVPLGRGWQTRSSNEWIKKVLSGAANYSELPMLYNGGFLDMAVVRAWMTSHARFFNSRIPDVYSGLFLAHVLPSYVYTYEPVAINGTSVHSTGVAQFRTPTHPADKNQNAAVKFASETNLPFHPTVPLGKAGDVPKSILALIYESQAQVCDVISTAQKISAYEQLRNILSFPGVSPDVTVNWAEQFATLHGLNLVDIKKALTVRKIKIAFVFYIYRLSLVYNSYFDAEKQHGAVDIYGAALAADAIKARSSPRVTNLIKNLWRIYTRLRKRHQ